jgi:glycosyltransferase involved in cell wall biosynthesis
MSNVSFKVLNNPNKTLASGWNIGIKNASGLYIIRPDAHAALHSGYILKGIKILNEMNDVVAVGGTLETKADGFWGTIIKEALSSKIGVGNSSFRTGSKSGYTDTVVYRV